MAPKRATPTAADATPATAVPEGTELFTSDTTAPGGSVSRHPNPISMTSEPATPTAADATPATVVLEGTELSTADTTAPGGSVSRHSITVSENLHLFQRLTERTFPAQNPEQKDTGKERGDSGTEDSKEKRKSSNKVKESSSEVVKIGMVHVDTRGSAGKRPGDWSQKGSKKRLTSIQDQKRPPIIDIGPRIIVSYRHFTFIVNGEPCTSINLLHPAPGITSSSFVSVAVLDVPTDPNILISPGADGFPIGRNIHLVNALNGLGFGFGPDFHRVFNPHSRQISGAVVDNPPILDLQDMMVSVGYDGSRYKFLSLVELEGDGTRVAVYTVGVDGAWRPKQFIPWFLRTDEGIRFPGAYISVGDSTLVNFLGFTEDPEYEDKILSFDYETEEAVYVPLPHEEYEVHPLLCALGNRLCCSYVGLNSLSIYQLVDNIWGLFREIALPTLPPHMPHRRFLPIHFHNNILLVAFRLDYDFQFRNRGQGCFIVDFAAGTTSRVNDSGGIHWFLAKPFVSGLHDLPY